MHLVFKIAIAPKLCNFLSLYVANIGDPCGNVHYRIRPWSRIGLPPTEYNGRVGVLPSHFVSVLGAGIIRYPSDIRDGSM
jgi:hypothetical protein